jgi:hypothetical protein
MADETTKRVWRGTHWATVPADHPEAQAANESAGPTGSGFDDSNPAISNEELAAYIDGKIKEAIAPVEAEITAATKREINAAVDEAIDRLHVIVDAARTEFAAAQAPAGTGEAVAPAAAAASAEAPAEAGAETKE